MHPRSRRAVAALAIALAAMLVGPAGATGAEPLALVCHSASMWDGTRSENFVTDYFVTLSDGAATVAGSQCRKAPESAGSMVVIACTNAVLEASDLFDIYRIDLSTGIFERRLISAGRVVTTVDGRCAPDPGRGRR